MRKIAPQKILFPINYLALPGVSAQNSAQSRHAGRLLGNGRGRGAGLAHMAQLADLTLALPCCSPVPGRGRGRRRQRPPRHRAHTARVGRLPGQVVVPGQGVVATGSGTGLGTDGPGAGPAGGAGRGDRPGPRHLHPGGGGEVGRRQPRQSGPHVARPLRVLVVPGHNITFCLYTAALTYISSQAAQKPWSPQPSQRTTALGAPHRSHWPAQYSGLQCSVRLTCLLGGSPAAR